MERIPFSSSLKLLQMMVSALQPASEIIPTRSADGRVLASAIHAWRSNPTDPLAAMDGIAVNSVQANNWPLPLRPDDWQRINTGECVSDRFDAVVRIEDVKWENEAPRLDKPVVAFQNVRKRGEDFHSGALLIPQQKRLRPQDLALLLTAGHEEIEVFRKPKVVFLPTGSELVVHASEQQKGKILESNSAMISGLVDSWGGEFQLAEPVDDELGNLSSRIEELATQCDVLVISAGTSMGIRDLTFSSLQKLGTVHFHGVAVHPARPVILADISGTPVLGLPGYPVAAFVAAHFYLRPLVLSLSKVEWTRKHEIFISAEDFPAKEDDYFYRVHLYDVDGRVYAKRILSGAGSIFSLSKMDGLMHVPPGVEIHKRDGVRVDIFNESWQNSFAIQGVSAAIVRHLFDLFHQTMPSHRILFWDASFKDALQSMVERNAHMAVISVEKDADPFPEFAGQLQEPLIRVPIFTRDGNQSVCLVVFESHCAIPAVHHLLDILQSPEFKNYIRSQDGCDVPAGEILEKDDPLDL